MAFNVSRINFALNVGEVSARFEARQDKVDKYGAGCRVLENWLPLTIGGVVRRPGFAYVAQAKFSGEANSRVVLVDFRFSSEQAYTLEFGDLYVRFFKDGAPVMDPLTPSVVHELVTPFALANLDLVKIGIFQSADVMYICTGIYPVHKLARISASPDEFTISEVAFNPPATIADAPTGTEIGSGTLTLSALTGSSQTITAANAVFLDGDDGRVIVSGAGRAIITSVVSGNVVNVDIISDFQDLVIAEADWYFTGFGGVQMDVSRRRAGQGTTIVADDPTFRSSDAGKYMLIYGGMIKMETYVSSTRMNGTILNTLRDVPNDPATGLPYWNPPKTEVWSIEIPSWTDEFGYPTCGCFFQSRMWLCKGQTINGSVTGDFENFSKGSNADDAIQRTLDDDQVNPIRWIKGLRSLQIATGGSAYEASASSPGKALSPSDFSVAPISSRGTANIPPVRIGGQLIYVQFGQKKLRELVFDFVTDKFKSPSLFVLAEHLTEENFVTDCCFQQEPDSVIWAVRDDGTLMALTYQEDENVIGWSRHPTAGSVISVTSIPRPSTGKDWLWAAIERDINGVTETYIEYMEPDADISREWISLQTDCAKIAVPDANLLVTGADHLEGATVRVIGDGMLFSDAVVTGGQFTLSPAIAVGHVEYGLNYDSEGLTLEPPIPPEQGGMFICRRWKALGVRVRRAGPGITLNVEDSDPIGLPVRKAEHPMDTAVPLQEGKLCAEQTNWGPFARVRFMQQLPFPVEIMNIVGDLEISTEWCCDTVDENPEFAIVQDDDEEPVPEGCVDTTLRGQQALTSSLAFDQAATFGGGNLRTSWGFIDQGEVYSLVGDATCAGGNMAYTAACVQINHFIDDVATLNDSFEPPVPDGLSAAINTRVGSADQPVWISGATGVGGTRIYYGLGTSYVEYDTPSTNFGGSDFSTFAIKGDEVWLSIGCCLDSGPPNTAVVKYDRAIGTLLGQYYPWGTDIIDVNNMQLTASYLYVLGTDRVTSDTTLYKIARVDGSLVSSVDVTALGAGLIAVASDDLIYIMCTGFPAKVYYLETFSTLVYIGYDVTLGLAAFGNSSAIWNNGTIYYGNNGFAGNNVGINKIQIPCPPESTSPIIASVTTDATVAAGADITVTWADILEPAVSDTIFIKPEPTAGVYGLVGTTVASATNSSALNDGSTAITIPGGTTPGNYVAMYAALGGIWVATSATFTVT